MDDDMTLGAVIEDTERLHVKASNVRYYEMSPLAEQHHLLAIAALDTALRNLKLAALHEGQWQEKEGT